MTKLRCPLDRAYEVYPEIPALIGEKYIITYREYNRFVSSVSNILSRSDITAGDMVVIVAENNIEYIILLMALFRLGAVACPVNYHLPTIQVASIVESVDAKVVIRGSSTCTLDDSNDVPVMSLKQLVNIAELKETSDDVTSAEEIVINLDQNATVVMTSGTMGKPKAALHSFGNHFYNALGSNTNIKLVPGDRWLLSLPLYHVGGLAILFRTMLSGATVVVPSKEQRIGDSIKRYGITHLSLVSTQLYRWLQEDAEISSEKLKAVLLGGGPVPNSLIEKAYHLSMPLYTSYGLTESASQVTTTPPGAPFDKLSTSGRILPHRAVKITDDGLIMITGRCLFKGYYEKGVIDRPVDDEGWFETGDTGYWDEDDYLVVTGRRDNMFISGGENIQPEEIETALLKIEGIENAIVVPVEDAEFGFRPVAFVKSHEPSFDVEKIKQSLCQSLPKYTIPLKFHEWPDNQESGHLKSSREFFRKLAESLQK